MGGYWYEKWWEFKNFNLTFYYGLMSDYRLGIVIGNEQNNIYLGKLCLGLDIIKY